MKVLYITTIGNTMGFFIPLIQKMITEGITVDIATNENEGDTPVPAVYREMGCKVFRISSSRSPIKRANIKAIHEIKKIVDSNQYDIVHCHTPVAAACTRIACKNNRRKGLRVFYTAHGFHFYKGAPLKNWLIYYPIEWMCSFWTDVLITINKEDYERAKKHLHAKRVEYVPGVGIDTKRFAEVNIDRAEKRREIGVPEDAVLLLSVGELIERKNHAAVIRAIAALDNERIHYAVAGAGPLREKLLSLAAECGVAEQVHFLGYRRDVAELNHAADIFAFPSKQEGLPVSVMEAMASGLPVVASDIRGSHELLENSGNILIPQYNDTKAYATAIQALAEDEKLRATVGLTNRDRAANYDISIITETMQRIYGL